MFSWDLLAFLLSSLTALSLLYYKAPTRVLQQGIALLLVVFLILSKKFIFANSKFSNTLFRIIMLTLSSLFVQLLVISSGGFYSPFLILLHLYTLGVSFLLKIGSAISFLVFSLIVLLASTFLNQTLLSLFNQDPGSVILYFVSFIVIIPLAQFLMSTYHLKDTISKLLTETLAIDEKREQSILQGLNELVLVTDVKLKILSFNEAVERSLNIQGSILGNNLLSTIHLRDDSGNPATLKSLSIDQVVANRTNYFVKDFNLETKATKDLKVAIQIKPITNLAGEINQIAFVITDARVSGGQTHSRLEQARQRQKLLWDSLKSTISNAHLPSLGTQALLLNKLDEDLLIAQELEDHPFKKRISYQDLVELCQQIKLKKELLAKSMKVQLQFSIAKEEAKEAAYLSLRKSNVPSESLPPSEFSVPTDPKWLEIALERLLDIAILLATGQLNPLVTISLSRSNSETIVILISAKTPPISKVSELFVEYYGSLITTNLRFGSGLEGFIAKTVASYLGIPLEAKIEAGYLRIQLKLTKNPQLAG